MIEILVFITLASLTIVGFTIYENYFKKNKYKDFKDDLLFDPETNTSMTLEEAESDLLIEKENKEPLSEEYFEDLKYDDEREFFKIHDFYRVSEDYKKITFSNAQFRFLENSMLLSQYTDWRVSNTFKNIKQEKYVSLIFVSTHENHEESGISDNQLFFWLKLRNTSGHYVFKEKTIGDKITSLFDSDNSLIKSKYKVIPIKKYSSTLQIKKLVQKFESIKNVEFEIYEDNLFIKTTRTCNSEDRFVIENVLKEMKF
ncbi:hypothetical protein [Aureivirga sp. CE67]|uniref:hypothetical protein n=1 Tax=Aureivirga sp. CE67 TaxID=1788983 RepID=UPI0018CBA9F7|nr:hypothetical protein [Aureivirga sp. CE67]